MTSGRWDGLDATPYNLRSKDKLKVTISNKVYEVYGEKFVSDYVTINYRVKKDRQENSRMTTAGYYSLYSFALNNNQPNFGMFADINVTSIDIPDGWILRAFSGVNFTGEITYLFSNKVYSEEQLKKIKSLVIEKTADPDESIRFATEDDNLRNGDLFVTKMFVDESEAPKFSIARFISSELQNMGFNSLTSQLADWRPGEIFCKTENISQPECYMLKTHNHNVINEPFTNKEHWQPFSIKKYGSVSTGRKGELFYRPTHGDDFEIWVLNQSGTIPKMPSNQYDNSGWVFAGLYKPSVF